jgi:hypothetical protein
VGERQSRRYALDALRAEAAETHSAVNRVCLVKKNVRVEEERIAGSSNRHLFHNAIATSLLIETEVAAAVEHAPYIACGLNRTKRGTSRGLRSGE